MAQYQWRKGGPKPKVEAQIFGEVIEKLAADQDMEVVSPHSIVEEARHRRSPIHGLFEWDDRKAGEMHRINQARYYVSSLTITRVEIKDGPIVSTHGFFSVKPEGSNRGYATQDHILSERDLRRQVLVQARRELETFLNKYTRILILCGAIVPHLQEVVDTIRDEIDALAAASTRRRQPTPSDEGQPETTPAQ